MKMKIRRIFESNPFDPELISDDGIIVKIIFNGEQNVQLNDIKKVDRYYDNYNAYKSIDDLLFYSIEDYIYNEGIGGYTFELYDKDGNKIEDINMYLTAKKYNL